MAQSSGTRIIGKIEIPEPKKNHSCVCHHCGNKVDDSFGDPRTEVYSVCEDGSRKVRYLCEYCIQDFETLNPYSMTKEQMQFEFQHVKMVRLDNLNELGNVLVDLTELLDPCDEFDGYKEEDAEKLSAWLGIGRDEHFTVRQHGAGYVLITLSPRFLTRNDLAEMFSELKVVDCYDTFVNEKSEVEKF
jgi:hypothetical protein